MKKGVLSAALLLALSAGAAQAQLVVGTDSSAGDLWVIDLANPGAPFQLIPNGSNAQVWGAAANNAGGILYWLDNGTSLISAPIVALSQLTPSAPIALTLSGGGSVSFTGLAYDSVDNILIGYRSVTAPGLYQIDPSTGVCTQLSSLAGDYGGIDFDHTSNALYACNDSTAGPGRGVVRIDKPFTAPTLTNLEPYPPGDTDIDGAAVGNGRVYMVNDTATQQIYVYNIAADAYEASIPMPPVSTGGIFSGGAWAPGLVIPPAGANVGIAIADPADCSVSMGGTVQYTVTVSNTGPEPATDVTATITLDPNAMFMSSNPALTPSGNTLTWNIGGMAANTSQVLTIDTMAMAMGSLNIAGSVTASSIDNVPGNNNANNTTLIRPAAPASAEAVGMYSNLIESETSLVPGLSGARFSGTAGPSRIFASADGNQLLMSWDTDLATSNDLVLFVHNAGTNAGTVVSQENLSPEIPSAQGSDVTPPPYFPFSYDTSYGINNAGSIAFSGIDNRSGTANDGYVVIGPASPATLIAQEATTPVPSIAGATFGSTNDNPHISTAGTAAFYHNMTGLTTSTDTAIFKDNGNTVVLHEGNSVPTGQSGGTTFFVGTISTGIAVGPQFSADHAHYIARTTLQGSPTTSDVVVIVDGAVVVQEGTALPDFASPVGTTIHSTHMGPNGDWMVSGPNVDTVDWVIRNGAVVAATDSAIFTGATETWDDASFATNFFQIGSNGAGGYIVGGTTSAADPLANAVIVYNNERVLLRENDPVDLDGDGVFNDGVYVRTFIDDKSVLTDTHLYAVVRLRDENAALCNGSDTDIGQAVIRVPLGGGGPACDSIDFNGDGLFPDNQDLQDFLDVFGGGACSTGTCGDLDFNNDGLFPDNLDLEAFFSVFGGGPCL